MRSILVATVLVIAFGSARADPIKKAPDLNKLAKEHVEKFCKALNDDKIEDAIKMLDERFMYVRGQVEENFDTFKQELTRKKTKKMEVKVGEAMELKKLNMWMVENKQKEFSSEKIAEIEKHMGNHARVVSMTINNPEQSLILKRFMMVQLKENKPTIVGTGFNS